MFTKAKSEPIVNCTYHFQFEKCCVTSNNNLYIYVVINNHIRTQKVKSTRSSISIPKLDLKSLSATVFADAGFNNLPDGGSQGGYIIFLNDKCNSIVPL